MRAANEPVPFEHNGVQYPGYVAGWCGHRVAESEWRAGFRVCERCPDPAEPVDCCPDAADDPAEVGGETVEDAEGCCPPDGHCAWHREQLDLHSAEVTP